MDGLFDTQQRLLNSSHEFVGSTNDAAAAPTFVAQQSKHFITSPFRAQCRIGLESKHLLINKSVFP